MVVWLFCGHLEGKDFFQKDVWLFCGQCAGHHMSKRFFCFLQQTYRHTFCLKNCFARVLPICNQVWFKCVAGAFAINFHTKPFVKKQVVGSFAANLQADTMSQTKQPSLHIKLPPLQQWHQRAHRRTREQRHPHQRRSATTL